MYNNFFIALQNYELCRLKCLLQLMAAAQAKRDVVYFTFGDEILQKDISRLYSALLASNCTVGEVSL